MTGGQGVCIAQMYGEQLRQGYRVGHISLRLAGEPDSQQYGTPGGSVRVQRISVSDSNSILSPYQGSEKNQYGRRREFCAKAVELLRSQADPADTAIHLHGFYYIPLMAAMLPEFRTVSTYHVLLSARMRATGSVGDEMLSTIRRLEVLSFLANSRIHAISPGMKEEILSLASDLTDSRFRRSVLDLADANGWRVPAIGDGVGIAAELGPRIHVVPNGVSEEFFAPGTAPTVPQRVVAWGRVSSEKGFEHLIRAAAHLSDWDFHILGTMGDTERDRSLYREMLVSEASRRDNARLDFRPSGVRGKELLRRVDSAEVVVVPSVYEPFGLVITEALARGKPVITTTTAGGRYIMGRNAPGRLPHGYLVDSDPEELSKAIEGAIRDYQSLRDHVKEAMREAARTRAAMFRWGNAVRALRELYG